MTDGITKIMNAINAGGYGFALAQTDGGHGWPKGYLATDKQSGLCSPMTGREVYLKGAQLGIVD